MSPGFDGSQESLGAGLVFFERDDIAAFDIGQSFVDARFRPCKIVALLGGALGDPFVDKLPRGFLDRGKAAARDMSVQQRLLFASENDHDGDFRSMKRSNATGPAQGL
ncbi:MAG: hypothetical protein ACREDM_12230 [Methylocella sp.]